ncbi:MAG: hypothetical protein JNK30_18740 [Phenylobacterium sp.]|uniref:hypothetical protein n=1 Tax=Phenylobacterium sp. TaxID=1871053 RepID=UPI001A5467F9|nr:hypothetical protein [Phenylobacterium sp.]MBL8773429.1 hypothetical protein [Phenylobacterium sp.]
MEPDRSLFGNGPYPATGPLAVLARVAFLGALLAIVVAVFLPSRLVPDFVRSTNLQHFAAYYVAGLLGLAASPRTPIRQVAFRIFAFATVLESLHLLSGARLRPLIDNWVADLGGLAAALAPVAVAHFRRRFERPGAG